MFIISAGLGVELAKWRESNHECMFFNNTSGAVTFLSLDAELMKKSMHPVLRKHLEDNMINIGQDLRSTNDESYWEILSSFTGVRRSREEVNKVHLQYKLKYYSVNGDVISSIIKDILVSMILNFIFRVFTQLVGASFCLTGDSLLKILAIVYRIRCKIPGK